MSASDITDLIGQLEEATEGNRELDMEIFWFVFPEYKRGKDPIWHCPHYTTSIDAALTLVPEGWRWSIQQLEDMTMANTGDWYYGHLEHRKELYRYGRRDAKGRTPALALCIAALRARLNDME